MNGIWDIKSDAMKRGDNARDVSPLIEKTKKDENGFTHYVFSKIMFNNPWYVIPDNEFELFKKFLDGGSRSYPSDGTIPCDIIAREVRIILNNIGEIANNPNDELNEDAREVLENGKFALVRGTLKLYLSKYATRDWRRKRFTDDIDFWIYKMNLYEYVLKQNGWKRVPYTKEWVKQVQWKNYITNKIENKALIAANDINLLLDFGVGAFLEGSNLRDVFGKKIRRGHDVDLSDIMNVVMVKGADGKYRENNTRKEEWIKAWTAFEESANTRNLRIASNLISLCRYSLAIADHLERIEKSLIKYHNMIFDKLEYPENELSRICRISIHWMNFLSSYGPDETRKMIYDYLIEQKDLKHQYSKNLRVFAAKVLKLLNSKYTHLKIVFEIEN